MRTVGTHEYYSDREFGPLAPTQHEISATTWQGLLTLVRSAITRGDFGSSFPDGCPNSPSACCGTDSHALDHALQAEVPSWPGWNTTPDVVTACDSIEFFHRHMALASSCAYHSYFKHEHFKFDVPAGQAKFRADVNLLLQRNGIALHLNDEGLMQRLLDGPTGEAIRRAVFQTDDADLNQLLEEARTKFMNPSPRVRQEALERVWDAWERLKTVKHTDKKLGAMALLDACASEPAFRKALEVEAVALTGLGNDFFIRHSETNKPRIVDAHQVDYLFHRMFAMLLLILRKHNMLA